MSSLKMTFSLASLVLILAFAFVVTPVFATPTVDSVEFTSTGPYGIDDKVTVRVTFSESVTVADNTATAPSIPILEITADAVYKSGSPGTALIFEATVASSDSSVDAGLSIAADALTLGGATIKATDDDTEDATLTHDAVAASTTQAVDTVRPTMTGWPTVKARKASEPIVFDLTFSENVTGVSSAFSIIGGGGSLEVTGLRTIYSVTITPPASSEAPITIQIDPDRIEDVAGNTPAADTITPETTTILEVDTKSPVLTIGNADPATVTDITKFKFKVTATEDVTGLAANDFTVTPKENFEASGFEGSAKEYNVTITAKSAAGAKATDYEGSVTVAIKADAAEDAAGNKTGAQSKAYTVQLDKSAPGITIKAQVDETTAVTADHTGDFYLDITIDETNPVTAAPYGISVRGNPSEAQGHYTIGNVSRVPRTTNVYTVDITVDPNVNADRQNIDFIVDVRDAAAAQNLGSETLRVNFAARTMTSDTTAPTVGDDAPTDAITAEATVTLTFSESVSSVTVTGDPTGDVAKYTKEVEGTGATRTVTITPTAAADLTADVPETEVTFTVTGQDAAGNMIAADTAFMVTLGARTAPTGDLAFDVPAQNLLRGGLELRVNNFTVGDASSSITLPEAMGGTAPYIYSLRRGNNIDEFMEPEFYGDPVDLPIWHPTNGLSVDLDTRVLSGTPENIDWRWYTWLVTDAAGEEKEIAFWLEIRPTTPVPIEVRGEPSLVNRFLVTFTAPETMPTRLEWHFVDVTGGRLTNFRREGNLTAPRVLNTLWYAFFEPTPGTQSIRISVRDSDWVTPAAENSVIRYGGVTLVSISPSEMRMIKPSLS